MTGINGLHGSDTCWIEKFRNHRILGQSAVAKAMGRSFIMIQLLEEGLESIISIEGLEEIIRVRCGPEHAQTFTKNLAEALREEADLMAWIQHPITGNRQIQAVLSRMRIWFDAAMLAGISSLDDLEARLGERVKEFREHLASYQG